MSTDHQKYSTANQRAAIEAYGAKRGLTIHRTYSDEGKSGLALRGRDALRRLIADVQSGRADFSAILVYDVSRWGRFQDADESAYYEYICKRAGIAVHYCAEQFENDGSPWATIVKSVKRAMAGEYSRELSLKVFAGQGRLVELGYRLGGYSGFGLRRMLVDQNGTSKGVLSRGQHKSITTDRLILVPGPSNEVETVRRVFQAFVCDRKSEQQIADMLNERKLLTEFGRPWNNQLVRYMLKSEKYAGHNVWNHVSFKLRSTRVRNSPEMWLRAEGVFEPVISQAMFDDAQAVFRRRLLHPVCGHGRLYSDKEMLAALRRLLKRRGYLTRRIIDESPGIQSAGAYGNRFGTLVRAYKLVGFRPGKHHKLRRVRPARHSPHFSDEQMLDALRCLLRVRGRLTTSIIEESTSVPCCTAIRLRFGSVLAAYQRIGYMPEQFRKRSLRAPRPSDEQMLGALRKLLAEHGYLSRLLIDSAEGIPSTYAYRKRFGGMLQAYDRVGYVCSQGRFRLAPPPKNYVATIRSPARYP